MFSETSIFEHLCSQIKVIFWLQAINPDEPTPDIRDPKAWESKTLASAVKHYLREVPLMTYHLFNQASCLITGLQPKMLKSKNSSVAIFKSIKSNFEWFIFNVKRNFQLFFFLFGTVLKFLLSICFFHIVYAFFSHSICFFHIVYAFFT